MRVHPVDDLVSPAGIFAGTVAHVTGVSLSAVIVTDVTGDFAFPRITEAVGLSAGFLPETSHTRRTLMHKGSVLPS